MHRVTNIKGPIHRDQAVNTKAIFHNKKRRVRKKRWNRLEDCLCGVIVESDYVSRTIRRFGGGLWFCPTCRKDMECFS